GFRNVTKAVSPSMAKVFQVSQAISSLDCSPQEEVVDFGLNLRMDGERKIQPVVTEDLIDPVHKVVVEMPKLISDSVIPATKFGTVECEEDDSVNESENEGEPAI
ncbi:hypothetical protein U1Q18_044654, partial [Sarracenia purpurea var. burkii]